MRCAQRWHSRRQVAERARRRKETTKQETEKTDNKKEKTEKAEKKDPSQEAYENFVSGIQKASGQSGTTYISQQEKNNGFSFVATSDLPDNTVLGYSRDDADRLVTEAVYTGREENTLRLVTFLPDVSGTMQQASSFDFEEPLDIQDIGYVNVFEWDIHPEGMSDTPEGTIVKRIGIEKWAKTTNTGNGITYELKVYGIAKDGGIQQEFSKELNASSPEEQEFEDISTGLNTYLGSTDYTADQISDIFYNGDAHMISESESRANMIGKLYYQSNLYGTMQGADLSSLPDGSEWGKVTVN